MTPRRSRLRGARLWPTVTVLAASASVLVGCAAPAEADGGVRVVATTPILADIASQVAGPDAEVTSLVPAGRDPHTFEPSLRTVRDAAHADITFSNGLLLEPQSLMDTVRETAGGPVIEVAENAPAYGAKLIPLVENVALDAVWLGLRTTLRVPQELSLIGVDGPGDVSAFIVSTFGTPQVVFDSRDGVPDATRLPAGAHTHLSWAFSRPGIYRLHMGAGDAHATVTVAVGVAPPEGLNVLDAGHIDISADGDAAPRAITLRDADTVFAPARTAVVVPASTLQPIPGDPAYRFLGRAGDETYLLPQAVLGNHVHGEVDPHLWHNALAGAAYADVMAEELALIDPTHGEDYRARARAYGDRLRAVDAQVRADIESIPAARRQLVTTHHGYAYLEQGYGLHVAGFVTPNPALEPSPRDVLALRRTVETLGVPAVFTEPQEQPSAATLREVARAAGVEVCTLYGDTLDDSVPTYIDLLLTNAETLARCLNPKGTSS
ncbi:anchored repeat ABC transporter, substrate-binding protein [uncultured Corynebacterium sp.]|uniref:anchored repeat ABC transporter, substrate-binding protein n=1 Tax=uncultured Corynebacterium sp. TaxID=159447 RepID=UPI00260086B3|nr:anchored repeat ABC transporter, substrate-binding protein [uncultured Corynebacterium sp.]